MVRLEATGEGSGATATADVQLTLGGQPLQLSITVPAGRTPLRVLLPVLQGLTDVVVGAAVQKVERQGQTVSCRKGCGACCRQVVPVAAAEARALHRLVEAMPEPRRSQVRARFAEVLRRLDEAGLLERLRERGRWADEQVRPLGLAYFRLGLACPFLEDESCSIHKDRPLACREYLVTSPAEACSRPTGETVRCVPMPDSVSQAVRAVDAEASGSGASWVPLALALEWAEAHPEGPATQTGPKLLEEVFGRLVS